MALSRLRACAVAALLLGVGGAASAEDVASGQAAYDAGHYDTAQQIWGRLAAAGDAGAALRLGWLADLGRDAPADPAAAYRWYLQAARAGLSEGEFNVAVMRDSGRGVARDPAAAALWYGRAAAHGNLRAAYDLAMLYQAGDGVPRNPDLARAWLTVAKSLPAAAILLTEAATRRAASSDAAPLPCPAQVLPGKDGTTAELTWTAPPGPAPARFFVSIVARDGAGMRPVLGAYVDGSALLAQLPDPGATYAWRVYAVYSQARRYVAGPWEALGGASG